MRNKIKHCFFPDGVYRYQSNNHIKHEGKLSCDKCPKQEVNLVEETNQGI